MEIVICKTKEEASRKAAEMITAAVKKNPKIKKRIICDEAWMLVSKNMAGHEFTETFLENCARRIRT